MASATYIRKYSDDLYKVVTLRSAPTSGHRKPNPAHYGHHNESKLRNSISRARSKIFELSLCNDWDYFITFTFDSRKVSNRYSLDSTVCALRKWINNYNSRNFSSVKYLLIPETHHDGAWHVHGLISGVPLSEIRLNSNGYRTWDSASNKFGFISLDPIRNPRACASYLVKYITKDLSRSISALGAHLYYASKRLNRSTSFLVPFPLIHLDSDYFNEHCLISWLNDPTLLHLIAHYPSSLYDEMDTFLRSLKPNKPIINILEVKNEI